MIEMLIEHFSGNFMTLIIQLQVGGSSRQPESKGCHNCKGAFAFALGHKDQAITVGRMPLWHLPIALLWSRGT
eukprot:1152638-Pelagomonas_calceolata.AAC.3